MVAFYWIKLRMDDPFLLKGYVCAAVSARTKGIPQIHLDFEILIFDKFDGVVSFLNSLFFSCLSLPSFFSF